MNEVYMIAEDGAAHVPPFRHIIELFEMRGYRECTADEYHAKRRELARKDAEAAERERNEGEVSE